MWSWDKRKTQTLSPRSANSLEYSTLLTRTPANRPHTPSTSAWIHQAVTPEQKLSYSGIPWGYYTTRRPFTTPLTRSISPTSSGGVTRSSVYGKDSGNSLTKYTYDRPLSQPHQYSKEKALMHSSWKSLPQPQTKQAPIQKRIDRTKRDKQRSSHTDLTLESIPSGNMSVNPLFGLDTTVQHGSQNGSLRDKVPTREKWSEHQSNSSVRADMVDNSIYKDANGHLSESDGSYISEVNSSPRDEEVNTFDQEIVQGQGVPLYATVFKKKQEQPAPVHTKPPSSPTTKKDEPVYSTIGERKGDAGKQEEQSMNGRAVDAAPPSNVHQNGNTSFNLQSLKEAIHAGVKLKKSTGDTRQTKELPPRKMSVLDELKLRFSGKKALLKSNKPTSVDTEEQHHGPSGKDGLDNNGGSFNPADVAPPKPPEEPAHSQSQGYSNQGSILLSNTPPPPTFNPPPLEKPQSGSVLIENSGQMIQEQKPSSREVLLSNIQDSPENQSSLTDVAAEGSPQDNDARPSTTVPLNTSEDLMRHKTAVRGDSDDSSDSSYSYSSDSELSSSRPSSVHVADGKPRSILKNKNEKPLINPEKLRPLSDSEFEDDYQTPREKHQAQEESNEAEEYNTDSLDRRGVSFTTDTLDNEGTAKKYEKEGLQMHKIDRQKDLPPTITIPKPVPEPAQKKEEEPVQDEKIKEPEFKEVQPPDVCIVAQDEMTAELPKVDATKDKEEKVTREPAINTVDGNVVLVKPDHPETSTPLIYTFTPSVPEAVDKPKPNGVSVVNGTLPSHSYIPAVSPDPSGHSKQRNPDMYFTLRKTGDNVSIVNISQDEYALDDMSHGFKMDEYSRDTIRSNVSMGTLRTMISIGGASDLHEMEASAYPGGEDDTLEHSLPFKSEMFEYKKQQTRTGKYQKKTAHGNQRSGKTLKKTTFADQAVGHEAHIKKAKQAQKNRKILRIAGFVIVVIVILITAVLVVYFLLRNDSDAEETVTSTPT